jgi:hypothetical protein
MAKFWRPWADWATPLAPVFDFASVASRLARPGSHECLTREQGRCDGRAQSCVDCQWSEGPERD